MKRFASLNPVLQKSEEYPFARLLEVKRAREAAGHRVLDFGMGDPRDPTPLLLREALRDAVPEVSSYPTVRGSARLRQAIAGYCARRFGVSLDPERHVLPLNGTKEGIFTSHLALLDPAGARRGVILFEPAYPVYRQGALYAGGEPRAPRLRAASGYLPELEALAPEVLERTALLWVNYPHNPTGAEATPEFYANAVALARRHGFVLASDECYADLFFGAPAPSALQAAAADDFASVLAFHSCSKRSCMTGFRSGFVAGDPALIAALAKFRPAVGVATPDFVQAAAAVSWSDAAHVEDIVATYGRRRRVMLDFFQRKGWHHDGGAATFYLWLRVPEGFHDSVEFAAALLERDVLVTPGAYLGESGEEHVRLALVATEQDCREAVARMAEVA